MLNSMVVTLHNIESLGHMTKILFVWNLWCIHTGCVWDWNPNQEEWFHTAPEQEQGPESGQGRMGYVPIFHILKLFPLVCFNWISVAFKCPVLAPYTTSVNGFCKILVLVPIPVLVPETVSVNTPLEIILNLFGVYLLCTIAMTWDILISQFPSCCEQVGFKELIARLIEIFFNKISDKL